MEKNYIEEIENLLEKAKIEIANEMERVGFIDDSDNVDRFLDNLAYELTENIEDVDQDQLLEEIQEHMKFRYNSSNHTNDRADYTGCYYKDAEGLKAWNELTEEVEEIPNF